MKRIIHRIMKYFLARPSIELAMLRPSHLVISVMRKLNEIQLSVEQLEAISETIRARAPARLLIFGLGNDSVFWSRLNRDGITIFLEDDETWLRQITNRSRSLTAFLVNYNTRRKDWKMLLESPSLLDMALPGIVEGEEWDIILVDAPTGWNDQTPGRMKSIYLASRLVKDSGDVFVHDCHREVEDVYCSTFLRGENLKREIKTSKGYLRHYHMTHRSI